MTATVLDDRRRLVLPTGFPARSAVTVQHIDEDTIIVKRQRDLTEVVFIPVPIVKALPRDADWEKVESAFTKDAHKGLAPFEE